MAWDYTPYAAVFHLTAIISIGIALLLSRRRSAPGTDALILLMYAVAEWSFAAGVEAATLGIAQKILWAKIEYLGAVTSPTLFLVFTLEYRQMTRFLAPRYLLLYSIVPLAALIVTVTNDWHGLIWNSFRYSLTEPNSLIYGHGPGFYVLIAYDYAIILVGFGLMVRAWFQSKQPFRQQISIILLSAIFPFLGGLIYISGLDFLPGLDLTPISFLITGLIISLGIIHFGLFDLSPIARHVLIENMNDGILVLDAKDRIVDLNPKAETILAASTGRVLGQPISEVLASRSTLLQRIKESHEFQMDILWQEHPALYFNLQAKPLFNKKKEFRGRLLAFQDVTLHRQIEHQLAQQNEELKIIEKINLAITAGLDMQQTIKTLHEQCSLVAATDFFYVALYDEERALVTIPLFYADGRFQAGTVRDIQEQPGTIGTVIRTRQTLHLQDNGKAVTGPLNPDLAAEKQARSSVSFPLMVRDKVVGVMSIQSVLPNAYREEQIHMLERIAVHAAIAIENARLYSEEQRLAIIDELTGIYNYRGLKELGTREVERARRFKRPLSLLFFDINDFRSFNNNFSHATGNIILQALVQHCRLILRAVDVFARFGGDEFVALLPETGPSQAENVARRLADEIASARIPTPHGELSVTVSIGLSTLTGSMADLSDLVDTANYAEHLVKQGRKRNMSMAK